MGQSRLCLAPLYCKNEVLQLSDCKQALMAAKSGKTLGLSDTQAVADNALPIDDESRALGDAFEAQQVFMLGTVSSRYLLVEIG